MRDSFVFYRSFYESMQDLPDDYKINVFTALCEYALNGNEVEMDAITGAIFKLMRPQIDANNKKYQNGKKGGRPSKDAEDVKGRRRALGFEVGNKTKTKEEPNDIEKNQTETKAKPKKTSDEPNVNVNDNENANVNDTLESVNNKRAKRFTPPTAQEVRDYCAEKGYEHVDADRFVDFYESKGWMVGKNKMKDWRCAVRNWNRSSKDSFGSIKKNSFSNFEQRGYDFDSLETMAIKKINGTN